MCTTPLPCFGELIPNSSTIPQHRTASSSTMPPRQRSISTLALPPGNTCVRIVSKGTPSIPVPFSIAMRHVSPRVAMRRHHLKTQGLSLSLSFSWKNGGPKQRRALSARRSAPKAKSPPQDIGPQTPRVPESRSAADTRPHSRRAPRLLFCESQLVRGGARGGP